MRKDRIFFIINEVNEELSLSNSPRQICNLVLNVLSRLMNVDVSWVRLVDDVTQEEILTVSRGLNDDQKRELQMPGLQQVLDERIGLGDLIIVPEISRDEVFSTTSFVEAGFGCLVIVPLATYQVKGVLGTMWRVTRGFDGDYAFLLMVIGNLFCSALDRAALYERLLGRGESESEAGYDIEEFEKLVALADRYSRATRLAIKEAVVRARGTEGPTSAALTVFGEGIDLLLPTSRKMAENEAIVTLQPPAAEEIAAESGDGVGDEEPVPAAVARVAPEAPEGLSSHESRMRAFIRLHPARQRPGL